MNKKTNKERKEKKEKIIAKVDEKTRKKLMEYSENFNDTRKQISYLINTINRLETEVERIHTEIWNIIHESCKLPKEGDHMYNSETGEVSIKQKPEWKK